MNISVVVVGGGRAGDGSDAVGGIGVVIFFLLVPIFLSVLGFWYVLLHLTTFSC